MTERIALVGLDDVDWAARSLTSVERQPTRRRGLTEHLREAVAERPGANDQ